MKSPFPYFGGKSSVASDVWARLGRPRQYIEPFCGSAALLLAAPAPAALEVIGDLNCYVANFWRALKFRADDVWAHQDYPVSHIDLYARHRWLTEPERVAALRDALIDPEWPGDPQIAGWWLWGQCCWIGSGWCAAREQRGHGDAGREPGEDSDASSAGRGTQAIGLGQIPHASSAGMGTQAVSLGKIPHAGNAAARQWLAQLSRRLERVRVVHGSWDRCLNHRFGGDDTAVVLDPPYRAFESLYGAGEKLVADDVAAWARENAGLRIALFGHQGDYDLPGWSTHDWSRGRLTYGGGETTALECIWFSPACLGAKQRDLFAAGAA